MNRVEIIKDIAKRLSDEEFVERISNEGHNFLEIAGEHSPPLSPTSLSHGYPGLVLLYSELNKLFPEEQWGMVCNDYIGKILELVTESGIKSFSLFSGVAGIAFSIACASDNGKRYGRLLEQFNKVLIQQFPKALKEIRSKDVEMFGYDVIEGVTGVGIYLLAVERSDEMDKLLGDILEYLVSMTSIVEYDSRQVPNWHVKNEHLFSEAEKQIYPDGIFNLGLSHGIVGPLILLSAAGNAGIEVSDQREAVKAVADDLIRLRIKETNEWNCMLGVEEYFAGTQDTQNTRDAWCYGTPGVSIGLLNAAEYLNDTEYKQIACDAMLEGIGREKGVFSPTFCHGYSCLALIYHKFYLKAENENFREYRDYLVDRIYEYYDAKNPFGFQNIEFNSGQTKKINSIALLDGTTGILLSLLDIINESKVSYWSQAFMLY